jgi:hypothetical protein
MALGDDTTWDTPRSALRVLRQEERVVSRQILRVVLVAGVVTMAPVASVRAASWADGLFSEQKHDFGPVARGAKVRHPFVLTNNLAEPITILNLRASCGCTSGRASSSTVAPGQSAVIDAEMDTRNFVGKKSTSLFVTIVNASGREAEVRLSVASLILADIVLNPGTIDFGTVDHGQTPQLSLTVDRLTAPQWRVERLVTASRAIQGEIVETARSAAGVSYTLTVSLKADAPAGLLRDEVRILTNDPESPGIPVQVTAQIRGDLSAAPSVLSLGRVTSATQGRFLIRGSKPFTVVSAEGANDGFKLTVDDATPKPMHFLTVSYRPEEGTSRGDLRHTFRVLTDLPGEPPIDLTAILHVDP